MKNPLFKRLPYILKDEIAKYLIIFLFMAGSIGLISGFLVADGSMIKAYNDSFYNSICFIIALAIPSLLFVSVISLATAFNSSEAFPIATPKPTYSTIDLSF